MAQWTTYFYCSPIPMVVAYSALEYTTKLPATYVFSSKSSNLSWYYAWNSWRFISKTIALSLFRQYSKRIVKKGRTNRDLNSEMLIKLDTHGISSCVYPYKSYHLLNIYYILLTCVISLNAYNSSMRQALLSVPLSGRWKKGWEKHFSQSKSIRKW